MYYTWFVINRRLIGWTLQKQPIRIWAAVNQCAKYDVTNFHFLQSEWRNTSTNEIARFLLRNHVTLTGLTISNSNWKWAKCWLKGQIISRCHLGLPNAYKLMCIDRNIIRNRDDKFFDCWDYWSLHWWKKTTLDGILKPIQHTQIFFYFYFLK